MALPSFSFPYSFHFLSFQARAKLSRDKGVVSGKTENPLERLAFDFTQDAPPDPFHNLVGLGRLFIEFFEESLTKWAKEKAEALLAQFPRFARWHQWHSLDAFAGWTFEECKRFLMCAAHMFRKEMTDKWFTPAKHALIQANLKAAGKVRHESRRALSFLAA